MKKKISLIIIIINIWLLQNCVTYEVKRLGGIKENERELEVMIDKQIKECYKLHSENYKEEE